jgi:hypothetical protein
MPVVCMLAAIISNHRAGVSQWGEMSDPAAAQASSNPSSATEAHVQPIRAFVKTTIGPVTVEIDAKLPLMHVITSPSQETSGKGCSSRHSLHFVSSTLGAPSWPRSGFSRKSLRSVLGQDCRPRSLSGTTAYSTNTTKRPDPCMSHFGSVPDLKSLFI